MTSRPVGRTLTVFNRKIAAAGLAAATLLAALRGDASGLRILLIGPSGDEPTVARVRQELALLGLDVEVITPAPEADLASLAREHHAAAAARVEDAPPAVVLWVDEEHSAGLPQETRITDAARGDAALLALRAVELLRGRLLTEAPEGTPAPPPHTTATATAPPTATATAAPAPAATPGRPAPSAAPSTAPPPTAPPPPRLRLHLGPALAVSPGGVPAAVSLRAGAAWRLVAPIELAGLVVVPLSAASVSASEGEMDLRVLAFGAGAAARWVDALPRLDLRAGAGAGVAGFLFEGRAAPPWVAARGDAWSAMPYVDAGASYRLTELVAVRADTMAALVLPPPVLVIAGREVASFGAPAVFVSLGVELRP